MIEYLYIQNFQSHKKTKIYLHKGINIIIGKNVSGKTAMLRSLLWLINNRPLGFRFKRHNAKTSTFVKIKTKEGNTISLQKTDKTAKYCLNKQSFECFKSKIPEEITKALQLNELNIQTQLSKPFLITDTPPEITRSINQITNIDICDLWIKNVNQKILQQKHSIEAKEIELYEVNTSLDKYVNFATLKKLFKELAILEKKINGQKENYTKLKKLFYELKKLEKFPKKLQKEKELKKLFSIITKKTSTKKELNEKKEALTNYKNKKKQYTINKQKYLNIQNKFEQYRKTFKICPFCKQRIKK